MATEPPQNWRRGSQVVLLITLLLVLAVLGAGCGRKNPQAAQEAPAKVTKERRPLLYNKELSQVVVYYLTKDGSYLVPVTVAFNPTREVAKVAVEKLLAGPQVETLKGVMPDGVKLRDVYLLDNQQTLYVDVTKEFLQINDPQQAQKTIAALVLTLTNLDNVRYVQILVEGQTVSEVSGVKIDAPLGRPASVNSLLKDPNQPGVQVYFSDASANFMVPVTVALPPGVGDKDLPRAALLALLAGPPQGSGLIRTVWPGTRLLDLKVEQGLATVDLSRQVTGYGGGSAAETALLNSLVLTLTGFPEINRVQLLIEGQKREYLPEGSAIDKPLGRPEQVNALKR